MTATAVDWYQATIRESPGVLKTRLERAFSGSWEPGRARWGYLTSERLLSEHGQVCELLAGGRHGLPHVQSSSGLADEFYRVIREGWPDHNVSRIDVRVDVDSGPGTWEKLLEANTGVYRDHSVVHYEVGDWVDGDKGRTIYLGAASSRVRTRSYEKGLERAVAGVLGVSPTLCRLEVQVRPQGAAKGLLAHLEPSEVWGISPWASDLLRRVTGELVERVELREMIVPPLEQGFRNAVSQYGAILERYADKCGGYAFLGGRIADELARQRR